MKFNCNRMETLASGDACPAQPSFQAAVRSYASFLARIKRTGQRTRDVGWVDLYLLESERLAVCYADDTAPADEATLVFPLINGAQFGDVKRHGNALTLYAMRVSLVLEAEPNETIDEESASTLAGKWSRTLNRLLSGNSAEATGSGPYFGGLGISVHASKSLPYVPMKTPMEPTKPRTKQLVPQPSAIPRASSNPSNFAANTSQAAPSIAIPRTNPAVHSMYAPQLSSLPSLPSLPSIPAAANSSIPNSRSLKRISLCLQGDADLGFGDDLKNVLATLDKTEEEQEGEQEGEQQAETANDNMEGGKSKESKISEVACSEGSQATGSKQETLKEPKRSESGHEIPAALFPTNDFSLPSVPFANTDNTIDSASSTPSPNSLYLSTEASSPPLDLGLSSSPKRLASILAKEQKQYVEKYGSRASTLTNFTKPNFEAQSMREPPKIPAPMPSKESREINVSNDTPEKKNSENSDTPKNATRRSSIAGKPISSAKTGPVLTRKTVSIAPMVHVIKESKAEDESDNEKEDPMASSTSLPLPKKPSSRLSSPKFSSPKFSSPKISSPRTEQKKGFVKTMKRILGKKKSKKTDHHEYEYYHESDDDHEHDNDLDMEINDENDGEETNSRKHGLEKQKDSHVPQAVQPEHNLPKLEVSQHGSPDPTSENNDLLPSPESIELGTKQHLYANLAEPDESPSMTSEEPKEVVADSTDNGRTTAAVPKLNSSKSISALSFRSLSSRSLASKLSETGVDGQSSTATTPEKIIEKPLTQVKIPEETEENQPSSPTMLRRESRKEIEPVPITLEPATTTSTIIPVSNGLYENSNKSTSAIPSLRQPITSAPAPHQQHPSTSSSFSSSFGSRRSLHSYTSSLSSASSYSTPNLVKSQDISLFNAQLWVSMWVASKWSPLSQLELKTEILASDSSTVRIVISGTNTNIKFTPQCEIRKIGNHDVEVKASEGTYMFRGRDPDNAQRFFKSLWTIQANGVQAVAAAALASSSSYGSLKGYEDDENMYTNRRRTLLPPTLSRSNQNLRYMGRSTETIIEE